MRFALSTLPLVLLAGLTAAANQVPLTTTPPSVAALFKPDGLSAYHPVDVSSSQEPSGTSLRATHTYTLYLDSSESNTASHDSWVVGLKGQQGWLEAKQAIGGRRVVKELTKVGEVDHITYYSVPIENTPGKPVKLALTSVTSRQVVPYPPKLPQTAAQMSLLWSADLFAPLAGLSAEHLAGVQDLSVTFKAPTPRLGEIVAPDGFRASHTKGGTLVTFTKTTPGDYVKGAEAVARVVYVQPEALAAVRKLERVVEVSHWGSNVAVQDDVQLYNAGPELEGNFARIEHQRALMTRRVAPQVITSLSYVLPPRISSPYYYDLVGNVSTSNFRSSEPAPGQVRLPSSAAGKTSSLELKPRYPLMGGWNFTYTIGYDSPIEDSVRRRDVDGKRGYVLRVPFLTAIKDVASDEVELSIRLPEGAKNIQVQTPFPVDSLSVPTGPGRLFSWAPGYTKSFLDSTGRPTVVLTKANCTDRHGGDVIVTYELGWFAEWAQKPVAVAAGVAALFAGVWAVRRIEWAI